MGRAQPAEFLYWLPQDVIELKRQRINMMRLGDTFILKTNNTGAPRTRIKGQAGRRDLDLAASHPRPFELLRLLYHTRRDHRALTWRQYFSQARAVLLVGFAFADGHSIARMTLQDFEPRIHPSLSLNGYAIALLRPRSCAKPPRGRISASRSSMTAFDILKVTFGMP